ncbi:MAG: conjugative transposon protein TraK [Bacteroidales bacterium]|nr:conjugative transposon protein TraK [Bacteroidales bacterium]MBO5406485.1 conjugative transposon protein TraK [Bacteroidales bacterium]MBQ7019262.1 conjugative transposon protein TraK [Bacteroidales bacterium]
MEKTIKAFSRIENSFKGIKIIALTAMVSSGIIAITSIVSALQYAEKQREKIYVLDQGKSLLLALQSDKVANKPIEVKDHITRFHELFFTLAPNVESIEHNINAALNLADRRAYEHYNDLQEQGYYSRLINASISQSLTVDSIKIDFSIYPYNARTYATMYIVRSNSLVVKDLITTCTVREIARSDANPHGLLLEKLEIINNDTRKEKIR